MFVVNVTDIKQYQYCPRIIYYHYVTPVPRNITTKMKFGSEQHFANEILERRRSFRKYGITEGKRRFHVSCYSFSLGLSGKIDMVIDTDKSSVPIEFKMSFREPMFNAKCQVAAYSLILEETTHQIITNGFIYCIPTRKLYHVDITPELKQKVIDDLIKIRSIVEQQEFPASTKNRKRCLECEYRNYCRDLF